MTDQQILKSMSEMLDMKLEQKMQRMEDKVDKKLQDFGDRVDEKLQNFENRVDEKLLAMEGRLSSSIDRLDTRLRKVELTQENEILPRLQNIESCYLSTYQRYAKGVEQIETMQTDVHVLKQVVAEHSRILQKIS